jgi:hypothetical protein
MNFSFLISFQSLGFALRRLPYSSIGVMQIMSPICTSSAFTLFTISPSNFRMMYSSLATWHCAMSTEYACCPKINEELQLSQNPFCVVVNFS